jgi:asparagine synthase (glutamine-hydrolysing)
MDPGADAVVALLRDRDGLLAPYIDFSYLNDLLTRHKSGLEDATDRIWRLLNLQIWGNIFITSRTGLLACPLP